MKKAILLIGFSLFSCFGFSQIKIKMEKENGVYMIPCIVNDLRMKFIFDTGASNVSISLSEAQFMLRHNYLNKRNIVGTTESIIANGNIVENTKIILDSIKIDKIILYDVEAVVVHEMNAPLLLGQSVIHRLGNIQLNEEELIINDLKEKAIVDNISAATNMIEKATDYYYKKEMHRLAFDTYKEAYTLSPAVFGWLEYYNMGLASYQCKDYEFSLKCFKESEKRVPKDNDVFLGYLYNRLGNTYLELELYEQALLNMEKSLLHDDSRGNREYVYYDMGFVYNKLNEHFQAIKMFKKSGDARMEKYTPDEINLITKNKKMQDEHIANCCKLIAYSYEYLNDISNMKKYMNMAATFGDEDAKKWCNSPLNQ